MAEKRTIEIAIDVTGINLAALDNLVKGFTNIGKAIEGVSKHIATLKTDLESLAVPKNFSNVVHSIQQLAGIKVPNIKQIAQGFEKLANIGTPPDLSDFATQAKKFSDIKVPNIKALAGGLEKLTASTLNMGDVGARLRIVYRNLKRFSEVKLPSMAPFVRSLKNLASVDVNAIAAQIKSLVNAISLLEKQGKLSAFAKFAADLRIVGRAVMFSEEKMAKFKKLLETTGNTVQQLSGRMRSFSDRLKNYFQYRMAADAVFGLQQAIIGGAAAIVEYDQALKNLQAIMQATDQEVTQMGAAIEKVASTTKFSATEVAAGMQILGQAGLSAEEAVSTIQAVSDLATGTLTDMTISVDLLTTALRVFDIAAEDSAHIADVFANAVNKSKLTIDKLKTAMNYVGPIAASAGLSLEETAAAMMTLANSGQRASTIGTGLRRMIAELVDPSKKMTDAAEKVGVSLSSLDPTANDLTDVLRSLSYVITDTDVAFDLFGKRGAAAALSLTNNVSGGFDTMLESAGRFGTASVMAEKQMEGLGVSIKNMWDKLGLLFVALGKAGAITAIKIFVDALRDLADAMTWVIDNGIKPLLSALSPIADAFLALPRPIKTLIVLISTLSGVLFLFSKSLAVIKLTVFSTALGTAAVTAFKAGGAVAVLAKGMVGLKAALLFIAGPTGLIIAAIAALAAAMYLLSENADRQVEAFETLRGEFKATTNELNSFIQELTKIEEKELDLSFGMGKEEILGYMSKLVKKYPELAAEVYATHGNIEKLNKVLEEHKKKIDALSFKSAMEGLDGYATQLANQSHKLTGLKNKWLIFDKDKHADNLAKAEAAVKITMNNIAAIVMEANEKEVDINWAEMFEVPDFYFDRKNNPFTKLRDSILAQVAQMESDIKKTKIEEAFGLYGLAGKWKREFDDAGTELQKFLDGNFEKNERYANLISKIDKGAVQLIIGEQNELARRTIEINKKTGDERLAATDQLVKDSAAANARMAADENVILIKRHNSIVKWEEKKIALMVQSRKDKKLSMAEEQTIYAEGQKKMEKAFSVALGADKILSTLKDSNKTKEAEFEIHQQRLTGIAKSGRDSQENVALQKTNAAQIFYNSQYLAAQIAYKKIDSAASAEKEHREEAFKIMEKARVASEKSQTDAVITNTNLRIAEQEREYEQGTSERETAHAGLLANIVTAEAKGIISHDQAEQAKLQTTLDYYDRAYQKAKEYLAQINKEQRPEEYQDRYTALLTAEKKYYNEKKQYAQKYTEEVASLNKSLLSKDESVQKKTRTYNQKLEKFDKTSHKKRIEAHVDFKDKLQEIDYDYAKEVEKIEKDLADDIEGINKDLQDELNDIADDRISRAKDLQATLAGVEESTADKIRKINQRGMTDPQKEVSNERAAYQKLSEAKKLQWKAEKTNNIELAKQAQSMLEDVQSLAVEFENAAKARNLVTKAGKSLEANVVVQKNIEDLESERKAVQAVADAEQKRKEAREDAIYEKKQATEVYDKSIQDLEDWKTQKLQAIKDTFDQAVLSENQRHFNEMADLDKEIAKLQEKLALAKKMRDFSAVDVLGDAEEQKEFDTSAPQKEVSIDNTLTESFKAFTEAITDMEKQYTASAAIIKKQQKEIAEKGYRTIEENGKKIYTTFVDGQRKATESFSQVAESVSSSITGIGDSGKAEFQKIYDEYGRLVKITSKDLSIKFTAPQNVPDLEEQIPEDIEVDLRITHTMDRVQNHLEKLQTELRGIGRTDTNLRIVGPEQITQIDEIAGKVKGLFSGLNTDDPKQKLQDMLTVMKGMGAMSEDVFRAMSQEVLVYAASVEGVDVKLAGAFTNGRAAVHSTSQVINEAGNALEGFQNKVQSNSLELFGSYANEEITKEIHNIEGAVDHLYGRVKEEIQLQIDTEHAQDAITKARDAFNTVEEAKEAVENEPIKIPVKVVEDDLDNLKQSVDLLVDKTVQIIIDVMGTDKIKLLKLQLDKLKDKTITVTTRYVTKGTPYEPKAHGGEVQGFNSGGSIFKKLVSPFITKGSGAKDDVPAMLMKGEFVHKISAVKKYGKHFMEMVNSGLYPLELAQNSIAGFANGGFLDSMSGINTFGNLKNLFSEDMGTTSLGFGTDQAINLILDLPVTGQPIETKIFGNQAEEFLRQYSIMNRFSS